MDREPLGRLLRSLRQLADPAAGAGLADAELLQRFARQRDHAAFELLVWRHGPMVLGACRRLLSNPHDADDAFQATWLVLVRKAGSINRGASLGSWLHRVACRVAVRLRATLARRLGQEQPAPDQLAGPAFSPEGREIFRVLDEEVDRLPARQRTAFVLCCLEGKTGPEAARQLGCRPGTVSSRLTRARIILRRRLTRRGLAPVGAGLALLAADAVAAPLSAPEVAGAVQAALLFSSRAAGAALSSRAVSLAEGVLRSMFLTKLQMTGLALLVAAALAAGSVLAYHAPQDQQPQNPLIREERPAPPEEAPSDADKGLPVVRVVKPRVVGRDRTAEFASTVQAFEQADLFSQVAGVVKAVKVDLGTRVKKGDVLAEIDAPLILLEERQAAAAMRQARGKVEEAAARVAGAEAEVNAGKSVVRQREAAARSADVALADRQAEYERLEKRFKEGAIPATVLDEQKRQLADARSRAGALAEALGPARADLEVKKNKVVQAEAEVTTAKANVEVAEAALQKANLILGFTHIRAPFDGVVTRRTVWTGDFARAADHGGGQPLLTVQRVDTIRLVFAVPEEDIPYLEPGMKADVTFAALRGFQVTAAVSRTAFAQDPQRHTMRAEIDLPNPKGLLRPGMSGGLVKIQLPKGSKRTWLVPRAALIPFPNWMGRLARPGETGAVLVVKDGKADFRLVRFEAKGRNEVEILTPPNLWPDELVVTNPGVVPQEFRDRKFLPAPVRIEDGPASK
jgi:RND family efflux transporter MFP subunit